MLLEGRPVCADEQAGEIERADPERMDEYADDREMDGVREEHEADAEHYRQHCGLIGVDAPPYRKVSRDSHWKLVSKSTPESREGDQPCLQGAFTLSNDVHFGER